MNWIVNKELSNERALHIAVDHLELNDVVEFIKNELPNFKEFYQKRLTDIVFKEPRKVFILHRDAGRSMDCLIKEWCKTAVKHSIPELGYYQDKYGWIVFELNGDLYQCHF